MNLRCLKLCANRPAQEFLSKFSQVAPSTLAPPSFPTDFLPAGPKAEEGAASAAIPDRLTFSFYLPHSTVNQKQQVRFVMTTVCSVIDGIAEGLHVFQWRHHVHVQGLGVITCMEAVQHYWAPCLEPSRDHGATTLPSSW